MSYNEISLILSIVSLLFMLSGMGSIVFLYHIRSKIKEMIIAQLNLYVQSQIDSLRQNPDAMVKLLKPVITKMLSDLSIESGKSSTEMIPQDSSNPMMALGLSFVPKKYQFLAQLGLGLLQSRKSSTGPVQKDGKNPFE